MNGLNKMNNEKTTSEQQIVILKETITTLVRQDTPDLSARQLAVFLICYLDEAVQTVRGLAANLNVSKPAITRALDRLEELEFVTRKTDPMDRRSVLIQHTDAGKEYLTNIKNIINSAAKK
ncbi:DNA-binding transcriptional regulator [Commensalibacter communis]|uniref:MarR family (MarR) n=1 Tax=Commensalibacter communis TaxID=2972786 RepID=A0A9W4TM80_9PROT|nr:MarR family transcriptional regulator [Commensalibacter communis]CAI3923072.1 DNA-binding transcriptional regulator [Commensalibacter communis]CAI3923609.1 DNA-binding transcriptional regulator [Commensalibacter communis]CAI3935774.1 DNA-binding transcriptional regulator [Commensalibacter communis]CAI3945465.1 DNA-binding transcriptional regulator [Commensalibacter communis]CAI3946859.1 DNA-binding transcriptional regulator [Commensalibacter communis]